jgi:hypothetical protein
VLAGPQLLADRDAGELELVPAQSRPPGEHGDVAPVGVDVQVVRVQMPDPDSHDRSQYGRTRPRSVTIRRSASIAV